MPIKRVIAIVLLALALPVRGADAPATRPTTVHDYRLAMHEFNRRTMGDAYKQVGKRDPKWDDAASKFLDAMALRMASAKSDIGMELPGVLPDKEIKAFGDAARAAGCDDPLVTYIYAILLSDLRMTSDARPLLLKSADELMASRYPLNRAMSAAFRQYQQAPAGPAKDEAFSKYRDLFCAMLVSWDFKGIDRRILYDHSDDWFSSLPPDKQQAIIDAATALKDADPWLLRVFTAKREIAAAWEARGSGWADTVTAEGNLLFHGHLVKAQEALMQAHDMHGDYPEAATMMITVAMAIGPEIRESPRRWFDYAVKAQVDYLPAYDTYRYAILPRWGGSISTMQAFADECLKNGDFTTMVPWQYVATVEAIVTDVQDPGYWNSPGVLESAREVCEGYVQSQSSPAAKRFFQTFEAAADWRAGHFDNAAKMLEVVDPDAPVEPFRRIKTLPRLSMSYAHAMADPGLVEMLVSGEKQAETDLDSAIETYRDAAAATEHKPASLFVQARLKKFEWQKQFNTGAWVTLTPTAKLTGWEPTGDWRIEDGVAIAKIGFGGATLIVEGANFEPRFDMEVTFEFPPGTDDASAGVSIVPMDPTKFFGFIVHRNSTETYLENQWWPGQETHMKTVAGKYTLRLRIWDDKIKADLNGESYPRMREMDQFLSGPKVYFTFAFGGPMNSEFRVSEIRIRKLTEEPPRD